MTEGYLMNEEWLKKCAEDYKLRSEMEGQRYQTLKAHTEEVLNLSEKETAWVQRKGPSGLLAF